MFDDVSSPDTPVEVGEQTSGSDDASSELKTIFTWKGVDAQRLEQVRVMTNGLRLKASGQIIAAGTDDHEPFSASYDLLTNELGVTRRLSIMLTRVSGETQISITRDAERNWLIQTPNGVEHGDFGGAEDVDLALSPFFNALPIRRNALHRSPGELDVPVVYIHLPEWRVEPNAMHYTSSASGVAVISPVASSTLTVDTNGFVIDYPGLATRI